MNQAIISNSAEETAHIAQKTANQIHEQKLPQIFCLSGPMGAGKSVFARAFIRHMMNDNNLEVPSPTFTLLQQYEASSQTLWHFDLYRLEEADEIYELGWEEAISQTNAKNILLIEWPERLGILRPSCYTDIKITPINEALREITINVINETNKNI